MKLCVIALLALASCQKVVDKKIQQHQKQQLDFERADQDFDKTFNDFS